MNQIKMGAPQGGMPNVLKPVTDAVNGAMTDMRERRHTVNVLAAQHALSSVRNERQHGYNMELQQNRQEHQSKMQGNELAVRQSMQTEKLGSDSRMAAAQRRHEMRKLTTAHTQGMESQTLNHTQGMERLGAEQNHELNKSAMNSANTVAELQAKFKGVQTLGKAGRVSEFKVGDVNAKFNPFVEKAPAAQQAPAPAAPEQPQATAAPEPVQTAKPSLMWNNPQTGRIEKRPEGTPAPVAKKAAAKKAVAKKGTPRPRKK